MTIAEIIGKRRFELTHNQLRQRLSIYNQVWLDIGTGDGGLVLVLARAANQQLAVGIDSAYQGMNKASRTAVRKPEKGGLTMTARGRNALFLQLSFEYLCQAQDLVELADTISVMYPWGSLLRWLSAPEPQACAGLYRLCKPGAEVRMVINAQIYNDPAYCERMDLPMLATRPDRQRLERGYHQAGFIEVACDQDLRQTVLHRLSPSLPLLNSQWQRRSGRRAIFFGFYARRPS